MEWIAMWNNRLDWRITRPQYNILYDFVEVFGIVTNRGIVTQAKWMQIIRCYDSALKRNVVHNQTKKLLVACLILLYICT